MSPSALAKHGAICAHGEDTAPRWSRFCNAVPYSSRRMRMRRRRSLVGREFRRASTTAW